MARTSAVSIRVEPQLKKALEQAAKNDQRSVAQFVELLIIDHLNFLGLQPEKPRHE